MMGMVKQRPIRSRVLREGARGEECTLRFPGICSGDTETVVLAHINWSGGVMGGKADDISVCYACDKCHAVTDARDISGWHENKSVLDWHRGRGMAETLRRMVEKGEIVIEGML